MPRFRLCVAVVTVCSASLLAQSSVQPAETGNRVIQTVVPLTDPPLRTAPAVVNSLTVIGNNLLGLPCLDCLLGILGLTIALPSPLDKVYRQGSYQVDAFLVDNNYSGACTFTFSLLDRHKHVVTSTSQSMNESPGTRILLSTTLTVPVDAEIGLGSVITQSVCGTHKGKSKSPVFLACTTNPPNCPSHGALGPTSP